MLMERSKEKELLDLGPEFYSKEEYAQCLKILFKLNKILGFFRQTVKILKHFPKDLSLIDVGCGGGLFLLNLNKHYPHMQMLGVDISEEAIKLAQNEMQHWQHTSKTNIKFQLQHETELQLAENSVDIVLMTLVCHHIEDEALILLLQKANKAARKAVIINDLHRHRLAYWFYKMLSPLLFRNRLITHDGLLSIKRSFTRREFQRLLQQANIQNYQIKWGFPFRWSVLLWKN